jgi:hypothetical protein
MGIFTKVVLVRLKINARNRPLLDISCSYTCTRFACSLFNLLSFLHIRFYFCPFLVRDFSYIGLVQSMQRLAAGWTTKGSEF